MMVPVLLPLESVGGGGGDGGEGAGEGEASQGGSAPLVSWAPELALKYSGMAGT